jgi:hypothetical protein
MRATIIVSDNMVSVDDRGFYPVDCAALAAEGKSAVQWYGEHGEVEFVTTVDPEKKIFVRAPNELIDDVEPYEPYFEEWARVRVETLAKAEAQREELERQNAEIKAQFEREEAEHQAAVAEYIANQPPLPRLDPYEVVDAIEKLTARLDALEKRSG